MFPPSAKSRRLRHPAPLLGWALFAVLSCATPKEDGSGPSSSPADPLRSPAEATWRLEDRTAELGVDFVHFNGRFGDLVMTEIMGAGGALLDLDRDGDLDLVLRQGRPLWSPEDRRPSLQEIPATGLGDRYYANQLVETGACGFRDASSDVGLDYEDYGMGLAAADFDGDGLTDLFLANYGPDRMLYRDESGGFRDETTFAGVGDERWSTAASAFDFDRDGDTDLFVGGYIDLHAGNQKTCGNHDYCGPLSFAPQNDRLFRNRGDGSFDDVTSAAGLLATGRTLGSVILDFDRDGWIDLYVANDASENLLWRNRGDGTFEEVALAHGCAVNGEGAMEGSMGVDAADCDGDGWEDLFMGHIDAESNTLFVNREGAFFLDRTIAAGLSSASLPWTSFGLRWADFDLDGHLDLVIANGAVRIREEQARSGEPLPLREPDLVFRNLGDGTFRDVTDAFPALAEPRVSRAAIVGDLDNDGDPDLVVTQNGGPATVLLDESPPGARWIGFRLLDPSGKTDRLGAEVRLERGSAPPLLSRVHTDGGYLSAHDPRIRFGLGDPGEIEAIVVRWPAGARERWPALPEGRYHDLVQGRGEALP